MYCFRHWRYNRESNTNSLPPVAYVLVKGVQKRKPKHKMSEGNLCHEKM